MSDRTMDGTRIDDQQASRWDGSAIAVGVGVALGVLPHLLGFVLGIANFLITPFLVPILAVFSGWWLGRRFPIHRWRLVIVASTSTGVAYAAAFIGQLALLARMNGSLLQTLALEDAVPIALGAIVAMLLFMSIGCLLSALRRKPKNALL